MLNQYLPIVILFALATLLAGLLVWVLSRGAGQGEDFLCALDDGGVDHFTVQGEGAFADVLVLCEGLHDALRTPGAQYPEATDQG